MKSKATTSFFSFSPWINCTFPIPTSNYLCPPQTPLLSIYVCRLQRICRHRCAAHSSRRYRRMCWVRHFIIFSSWRKPLNFDVVLLCTRTFAVLVELFHITHRRQKAERQSIGCVNNTTHVLSCFLSIYLSIFIFFFSHSFFFDTRGLCVRRWRDVSPAPGTAWTPWQMSW